MCMCMNVSVNVRNSCMHMMHAYYYEVRASVNYNSLKCAQHMLYTTKQYNVQHTILAPHKVYPVQHMHSLNLCTTH